MTVKVLGFSTIVTFLIGKVNLVGTLGDQKKNFSVVFKSVVKNKKKIKKKWVFLRKICF